MKSLVRLLMCALFVATAGASALGGPSVDVPAGSYAGDEVGQKSPMMLAGSNGHDSVGGLMPLPLWPPMAVGVQRTVPARPWKRSILRHPTRAHMKLTLADCLMIS